MNFATLFCQNHHPQTPENSKTENWQVGKASPCCNNNPFPARNI